MIADATFLSDFHHEHERGILGPARRFLAAHRNQPLRTTVISAGEIAVIFRTNQEARVFLSRFFTFKKLFTEIAYTAASIDRELIATGERLGENDNWIAAFCRYYSEPLISNDTAFDRVRGLRRLPY
jgi:predicted nucleic acid-binding protein